jgi:hypothetical protein
MVILVLTAGFPAAGYSLDTLGTAASTNPGRDTVAHPKFSLTPDTGYMQLEVAVTPPEAAGASLILVRQSVMTIYSSGSMDESIPPDTLGTWRAPLSMFLQPGHYSVTSVHPDFRSSTTGVFIRDSIARRISISMFSIEELKRLQSQWRTTKWISAGTATGMGLAALFCHARVISNRNDYHNTIDPAVAAQKRESIGKYQNLVTISSSIAFTALAGALVSWLIESLYAY